ncbi:MAG TPA: peptidylprolyl isomerase [Bryobacteraceae bacterium]|nr:peptidylprolyl isomerase [Bryobacteraceae bacterium]
MKSLHFLLYVTPVACLLAQTPPPSHPSATPPVTATTAPTAKAVPPDTVVLTVGDEKMTAADVDRFINALPEQYHARIRANLRQFADNIVNLKVMAQEAKRRKLDETVAFKQQVEFQTEQLLARELSQNLQTTTKVDEVTAQKYYEEHKGEYVEVKASHILIREKGSPVPLRKDEKDLTDAEALAKAQEIRKKIADGADFAEVAKTESDDVGSGAKGGDLGTFGHGRMVPDFEKAAFTIPVGELSQPVKSPLGYHIIKVESRQEKTFAEVRPEIERRLASEAVRKEIETLKESAHVVMNPDYFGASPSPINITPSVVQPK